MDQVKIGQFLKELRKEKNITQEALAEILNVSSRTISRWETGSNMPDITLLVELADYYEVTIPEIINGERKSETMNQETRETAIKMAEYSKNESKIEKRKLISLMMIVIGAFLISSALAIFPNESSWGSIYSILGAIIVVAGVGVGIKTFIVRRSRRIITIVGCIVLLFGLFTISDYVTVAHFHQAPRFSYSKSYGDNVVKHKTLFFTVIQRNPGTENEQVEFAK